MIPIEKVKDIVTRYDDLEKELASENRSKIIRKNLRSILILEKLF